MKTTREEIRRRAIEVMKQGGIDICENARTKHLSGKYGTSRESAIEYAEFWNRVEDEVRSIAAELNQRNNK